ncbi:hypothetical protein G7Y89_g3675 [Cudoniella acicularis]|uniref:Catabolite repression protein creC n=1 Tax=Cudoniella acicularis TaxID=354080 RepID=A0A8H4RQX0_9HELO|nr:hypothetical protein G7Y89_g3675 [Cudoniella acicularis]
MFVLPPPPRYPSQAAYNLAVANGQATPMIETNNILSHPTGPEYQLVVGEGTYILREDLHLATPPPHPSEAPVLNPNPLATTPQPATAGTRISLLSLSSRGTPPLPLYRVDTNRSTNTGFHASIQEHPSEGRASGDVRAASSDGGDTSMTGSARATLSIGSAPAFGEGNSMLSGTTKDAGKRRKPKNNIAKSNSSFISRCIVHENLGKRLQDRPSDGYFAFANINRAFQWIDLSSPQKVEHINSENKYRKLNIDGIINSTPVSEIRWIPGSENLFLAAHMDGSLVVYDKEKDDAAFLPEENHVYTNGSSESSNGSSEHTAKIHIDKSVHSKNQKFNPVSFWKLSNQRINAFAFSPDNRHIAVVSEDGTLRIIDYLKEQSVPQASELGNSLTNLGFWIFTPAIMEDLFAYAGHQMATEATIVARCQGHQSWVTAVCFDPWRCDDRNYRFGSVGEDCRLLLWDFSVGMLHRPKASSVRQRGSVSSRFANPLQRQETQNTTASRLRSNSAVSADGEDEHTIEHPVQPRATTAMLPPVMSKVIDPDPLCWLEFTQESVITSCKSGHIRTWDRPRDGTTESDTKPSLSI